MWITQKGYDQENAGELLSIFLKEKEKYKANTEIYFLMNHPATEWRLKKIKEAVKAEDGGMVKGEVNEEDFLRNMVPVKLYNASLNMQMDRFEHARDDIDWVLKNFPQNSQARYLSGEIYRLEAGNMNRLKDELNSKKWHEVQKANKDDALKNEYLKRSEEEYLTAMNDDPSNPDPYKGLGMLRYEMGDNAGALESFTAYLQMSPEAKDSRFVNSYINRINKKLKEPEIQKG